MTGVDLNQRPSAPKVSLLFINEWAGMHLKWPIASQVLEVNRRAPMSEHTVRSYNEELDRLKDMVLGMGRLTRQQLEGALDAAERSDSELAAQIIGDEPEANRMEHEIDELAVRLLALRQPVAIDLRAVLSAMRIANELERVCDYAADLAERLKTLHPNGGEPVGSLVSPGRFAVAMLTDAMLAYENGDDRQALEVWGRDKELDKMYTGLFRELLTHKMQDARQISVSIQMLFMARDIERAGDRATNIAEIVRYLVRGTIPEEVRPKADATRSILAPKVSSSASRAT
jgi:phosphate transport system protein